MSKSFKYGTLKKICINSVLEINKLKFKMISYKITRVNAFLTVVQLGHVCFWLDQRLINRIQGTETNDVW